MWERRTFVNSINGIKQLLKKNKTIDSISRIVFFPLLLTEQLKYNHEKNIRKSGYIDQRFKWIYDLKDSHVGERCFIVATGPSLRISDLDMIKNEYCFGMNSDIKVFDKTDWRPNFYAVQDVYVYEKLEEDISKVYNNESFLLAVEKSINAKYKSAASYNVFETNKLDHKMFHMKGFGKYRFSDDSYVEICDGYSITFSILQFACYMGFKEIYLLGCDCNYNQPKTHFIEYGHKDPKAAIMGDKMIVGHRYFRKFAESIGVDVINCTRGGMLEEYTRKSLEDVLNGA